jgi:hypothetical protein
MVCRKNQSEATGSGFTEKTGEYDKPLGNTVYLEYITLLPHGNLFNFYRDSGRSVLSSLECNGSGGYYSIY